MTIFLILAPYGAFTTLMLLTSAMPSLCVAASVCLAVIVLDAVRGRSVKLLGAGGAVVFAGIGSYLALIDPSLSNTTVNLAVDTGVFIIMAGSILVRYPFTLQYARESVPAEIVAMPGFLRTNYVLTGAWTAASLLMMLSNLATLYVPGLPIWISMLVAFTARNSAVYFTKWYPQHRKLKSGMPPGGAEPSAY